MTTIRVSDDVDAIAFGGGCSKSHPAADGRAEVCDDCLKAALEAGYEQCDAPVSKRK